jgi:hypothetical protein
MPRSRHSGWVRSAESSTFIRSLDRASPHVKGSRSDDTVFTRVVMTECQSDWFSNAQ